MVDEKATVGNGVHGLGHVYVKSQVRSCLGGTENDPDHQVQDTINRITAYGVARFAGVWGTGCLLDVRPDRQRRSLVCYYQP